jgi:transglutaminase/protease-like cytokinesis protein 3
VKRLKLWRKIGENVIKTIKLKKNKKSAHILMLIFAICILGAMSTWAKEKDSDSSNYEHAGSIWEIDNIALIDNDIKNEIDCTIENIITPEMSDYDKVKAVHDYIVLNCEYDYENYVNDTIPQDSYSPRGVLINKKAVCEGYAAAFKAFMDELSIPCKLVSGKASSNGDFTGRVNHAWNRVEVGGVWYQIDVTWDDPVPDQKGKVRYKYFLLSEEEMNKTHLQVRNEKKI